MSKTIAIAGLGWLGMPLAVHLLNKGYDVKGSVSRLEKATQLQQKNINAYPLLLTEDGVQGQPNALLKNCDELLIMIPPGLRYNSGSDFVLKMVHFQKVIEASSVKRVLLISSTSVFGDYQGEVTETTPPVPETQRSKQLFQVEQLFLNATFNTTVIRFGGLIGGTRQPVRYLAGRKDLYEGNAFVNLIHRDDCIRLITLLLEQENFNGIVHGVHPNHPRKKDYYKQQALNLELEPPLYIEETVEKSYKVVNSTVLSNKLNFTFKNSI